MGQKIRKARLEKGLKQAELARKLKVDEMSIVGWELDKHAPSNRNIKKLKEYLEI